MNARLAIALIALGVGCARDLEDGASNEVLQILAEHRLVEADPEGVWFRVDEEGTWVLRVQHQEDSGRWTLRREHMRSADARRRASSEPPDVITTSGGMESGVLILDSPLEASTRLHLCRFGHDDFLLPEHTVRFESASSPRPEGAVYRRVRRSEPVESFEGERHVVESLPAGTWEAIDCPEWTWLEIRPSGVHGEYRVRRSLRRGDDPTPVNSFARATWEADVLSLDSPLFSNASWRLRRWAEEDWLVPRAENREEEGGSREPAGMRFRLVSLVTRPEGHIYTWDGVDPPEEN